MLFSFYRWASFVSTDCFTDGFSSSLLKRHSSSVDGSSSMGSFIICRWFFIQGEAAAKFLETDVKEKKRKEKNDQIFFCFCCLPFLVLSIRKNSSVARVSSHTSLTYRRRRRSQLSPLPLPSSRASGLHHHRQSRALSRVRASEKAAIDLAWPWEKEGLPAASYLLETRHLRLFFSKDCR